MTFAGQTFQHLRRLIYGERGPHRGRGGGEAAALLQGAEYFLLFPPRAEEGAARRFVRRYDAVDLPQEKHWGHDAESEDGQPDYPHVGKSPVNHERDRYDQDEKAPPPDAEHRQNSSQHGASPRVRPSNSRACLSQSFSVRPGAPLL